ncbi:MAG: histidine kinase [Chitinophagaceae bacterium]|nr:histidine kinase [Chitinophagaceae bacterium]
MKKVIGFLKIFYKPIGMQIFLFFLITPLFNILFSYTLIVLIPFFITSKPLQLRFPPIQVIFQINIILAPSLFVWNLIYFLYKYIKKVRAEEENRAALKIQIAELQAKKLRAQMNPHFIYNCLNTLKVLIRTGEKQNTTTYLTTFSKLIRALFQNSDKQKISLYDEIENCKLYTQLESIHFGNKIKINFRIDSDLDLKSVMVPALIVQPFIENAIWHGIAPKENGGTINITIKQQEDQVLCEVDDDGIGRRSSQLNKASDSLNHESKGVHLSEARLDLEKTLNDTYTGIKIYDKYEQGEPMGTKVILIFNLN